MPLLCFWKVASTYLTLCRQLSYIRLSELFQIMMWYFCYIRICLFAYCKSICCVYKEKSECWLLCRDCQGLHCSCLSKSRVGTQEEDPTLPTVSPVSRQWCRSAETMHTSGFNFFPNSTHPAFSLFLTLSLYRHLCWPPHMSDLCSFEELCVKPEVKEILGTLLLFWTKAHCCKNAVCRRPFSSVWAELWFILASFKCSHASVALVQHFTWCYMLSPRKQVRFEHTGQQVSLLT